MSTVTPILDTLVHQVLGRRASLSRFAATRSQVPIFETDKLATTRNSATQSAEAQHNKINAARGKAAEQMPARIADATRASVGGSATASGAPSAQLQLSREGQAISVLLSRFATAPMATSYTQGPVFNGAQLPAASVLAALLGRQVAFSGVFYESHLQKWLKGHRSLKQLQQEPQGKLKAVTGQASTTSSSTAARAQSTPAQAGGLPGSAATTGAAIPRPPSLVAALTGQQTATSPIHDSMLPVVRQQLDALSASVFRWQGMAWPNAPMQWEIHQYGHDADQSQAGDGEELTTPWSTRLKLELPTLGTLEVQITLSANALQMFAWAETDKGAAVLKPQTPDLQQRLQKAGFDSASVQFLTDDDD